MLNFCRRCTLTGTLAAAVAVAVAVAAINDADMYLGTIIR